MKVENARIIHLSGLYLESPRRLLACTYSTSLYIMPPACQGDLAVHSSRREPDVALRCSGLYQPGTPSSSSRLIHFALRSPRRGFSPLFPTKTSPAVIRCHWWPYNCGNAGGNRVATFSPSFKKVVFIVYRFFILYKSATTNTKFHATRYGNFVIHRRIASQICFFCTKSLTFGKSSLKPTGFVKK